MSEYIYVQKWKQWIFIPSFSFFISLSSGDNVLLGKTSDVVGEAFKIKLEVLEMSFSIIDDVIISGFWLGLGVARTGLCGIDGTGLDLIDGTGLCWIDGTGLCWTDRTGLCWIDGTGLCLIDGTGLCWIDGTGLCWIDGTGLCWIDGTGLCWVDGTVVWRTVGLYISVSGSGLTVSGGNSNVSVILNGLALSLEFMYVKRNSQFSPRRPTLGTDIETTASEDNLFKQLVVYPFDVFVTLLQLHSFPFTYLTSKTVTEVQ